MNPADIDEEISSAIMEVALSLDDPASRRVFLDRVFENREAAKVEMTGLLEAADGAATFFLEAREQRARVTATILSETHHGRPIVARRFIDDDAPPEKLGPYRLISRLGEGGGGVVYEAEQEHPICRRVALKIVRMEVENPNALARFDIERQALALMDHPNIAKVLDAGTTPTGKPYFAMELVTGEPITTYCNRHKLDCRARLELFVLVCNAIQHAHQKGIIHRDIKPSNVIVTRQDGANVPKIIDFGIAKSSDTARREAITAHDQFFGTPAYMSPEQVAMTGIDVDTRSDIFSLGVLLYELLTGATPIDRTTTSGPTFSEIRKTLLTWETLRPSEILAKLPPDRLRPLATERGTDPSSLASYVEGDLDWIVMMALEKNRTRRYQTANALATDIKRFLGYQPIAARPPSRVYVLAKFVRRNRLAFGAAVVLVTMLVTSLAITAAKYESERRNATEQLRLKNEAQAARNQENRLRKQADARSNVARTAFLLDQGRIDEADALRREYPLSSIEPSLEAAAVFRSLGDWNSENGSWDQAHQCFQLLRQANRLDVPQKILQGDDLMAIAAALLRADEVEYRAFRDEVMALYAPADGDQKAEHLLKVCLIHPAPRSMIERLRRDVATMGDPLRTPCPPWSALSLSLFHLRDGNGPEAMRACGTGLRIPSRKSSCEVSLEAVAAMVHHDLGHTALAEAALQRARDLTETCAGKDFENGKSIPPYWFDWVIAELLVKEAGQRIEGPVESPEHPK
ncbi:serine/threonine protein kinase [Luteolibacter flavescens]|uniref:Serine/threonine protein kinase n=1 Tax=Luteolibacter flavescens TaxID=1859460 RepID=A0ABT3FMW8_9BACT|nr:serine/threonine-protein kinase [Luteolibacter flavescens]MCW1884918.1 serine/threonine protein kinase [Luteolibacter flavescens]